MEYKWCWEVMLCDVCVALCDVTNVAQYHEHKIHPITSHISCDMRFMYVCQWHYVIHILLCTWCMSSVISCDVTYVFVHCQCHVMYVRTSSVTSPQNRPLQPPASLDQHWLTINCRYLYLLSQLWHWIRFQIRHFQSGTILLTLNIKLSHG